MCQKKRSNPTKGQRPRNPNISRTLKIGWNFCFAGTRSRKLYLVLKVQYFIEFLLVKAKNGFFLITVFDYCKRNAHLSAFLHQFLSYRWVSVGVFYFVFNVVLIQIVFKHVAISAG